MSICNYNELDPGIREVVKLLRDHGFITCDSGDGKTKKVVDAGEEGQFYTCALPQPNVFMQVEPAKALKDEADRLCRLIDTLKLPTEPIETAVAIQANYSPQDGKAFLELYNLDDKKLAAHR